MKERDLAVKRSEDVDAQYQDQTWAAQTKYDLSLACLHRMDIALAGMPCFPVPRCSELTFWFSELILLLVGFC